MNWTPTPEDIRVARLLDQELGPIRFIEVIHHKENRMTEQAPENDMWDGEEDAAPGGATFPEYPDNPHEAPLSVNFKPGGTPQLTVRGRTVAEHMDLLTQVADSGLLAAIGRVNAAFGGQGSAPAPQGQPNWNPVTPPPNQPYPGQPAWQQAGAPQAPAQQSWGGAPQGGFNGGQQAAQGQRKEYPAPQGWYKLNVPFPGGKDQLHALATQYGIPKGGPGKGGKYNFYGLTPGGQPGKAWYCAPEVAQAFQQFSPVVG